MTEKYYAISAKDPLASWNETYTENQLIAKFWDYAEQEWGEADLEEYKGDKFNLEFIQDFWGVTFVPFADEDVEIN